MNGWKDTQTVQDSDRLSVFSPLVRSQSFGEPDQCFLVPHRPPYMGRGGYRGAGLGIFHLPGRLGSAEIVSLEGGPC